MNIIQICISAVTMLLIGIASQLLAMERHVKLLFVGIWGVVTIGFLIPFSISRFVSLSELIEAVNTDMIQIQIAATAMIIVGVAIRFFAISTLPKITFVIIWGLVTIRLLIPFSFSTRFNIWSLFEHIGNKNRENSLINYKFLPQWEQISTEFSQGTENLSLGSNGGWLPEILFSVWIIGVIICALYFIITHYQFRKEIGDSLPVKNEFVSHWICEHQHKMIRPMQIRQSHKISSPLTYGILRPVILLPKTIDWQDETQLTYIFAHEYVHIRRFDYVTKMVFAIVLCVHWFNPFVWLMYMLTNRDLELSCDEAVLKIFGQKSRSSYALTLLNMAESKNQFTALYNNFSKYAIEERIQVMINMKKTSILGATLALTLVGGAMTAFASSPDNNTTPLTSNKEGNMEIPNDSMMDYHSYKAWRTEAIEEIIASGDYSPEEIEFFKKSTLETLNALKNDEIILSMFENEYGSFKISVSTEFADKVSLQADENGEQTLLIGDLEE